MHYWPRSLAKMLLSSWDRFYFTCLHRRHYDLLVKSQKPTVQAELSALMKFGVRPGGLPRRRPPDSEERRLQWKLCSEGPGSLGLHCRYESVGRNNVCDKL